MHASVTEGLHMDLESHEAQGQEAFGSYAGYICIDGRLGWNSQDSLRSSLSNLQDIKLCPQPMWSNVMKGFDKHMSKLVGDS